MPGDLDAFEDCSWATIFLALCAEFNVVTAMEPGAELAALLTTVCCGNGAGALSTLRALRAPVALIWRVESWLVSKERFSDPDEPVNRPQT